MHLHDLTAALSTHLPQALRWSGAVAKRLRQFNIAVGGKSSGSANTDALTLADLSVQEFLVACLRDSDPIFRQCNIAAEEFTGDLERFATDAEYTITLDPIDGTKQYRDKTGDGYAVVLTIQSKMSVYYSLVFIPEHGPNGSWVKVENGNIICGPDDPGQPAADVLRNLPSLNATRPMESKKIYLIGFQQHDVAKAQAVTDTGLIGVPPDEMPGCVFDLIATGEFAGSLIHSPNIYDFPVSMHIARSLGGDAQWVHNGESVHFEELWMDPRADMLRLPGIVACSPDRSVLKTLVDLAKDWNPVRYAE